MQCEVCVAHCLSFTQVRSDIHRVSHNPYGNERKMAEEVFYKKVGRRYVECHRYDGEWYDSVPTNSAILIVTQKGSTSRKYNIDVAIAPLLAGGMLMKDAMVNEMVRTSEVRPNRVPLTEAELAAWNNLIDVGGDSFRSVTSASANDIVQAGVEFAVREMQHILQDPTVADAYNKFVMSVKLKLEQKNIV